jgi:extracellular factor (EF) 3-hydroxypalmitic acid methyl ester biosynthesis protein
MARPAINLTGILHSSQTDVPIKLTYGSRFSFFVEFTQNPAPTNDVVYENVTVRIAGDEHLFGACRFIPESNIYGYSGRLIFVEDVYDFRSLIFERRVLTLETSFQNLNLILAQKEKILHGFREYTSSLTYDLEVYRHFFDELDARYMDEPQHVAEILQKTIIDREGANFMRFFDQKLEELRDVVKKYAGEDHKNHGFYFRKQVWGFITGSDFFRRTNLKPRGYTGDSEMLNMVYENGYRGNSTFSKLLHKHPVDTLSAQAVRNRRTMLADAIRNQTQPDDGPLKIMSVACGAAVEMVDVFVEGNDLDKFHFTLFDQDVQALSEAGKNIERIEEKFARKANVEYLNASVRTMLRTPQVASVWGKFHLIYSMGLFDYLTPPVAKAIAEKIYDMLTPGGLMIIGNFHVDNPDRFYMEYWMDWVLYYRTETEFLEIVSKMKDAAKTVEFEPTRCQMFLQVRKPE